VNLASVARARQAGQRSLRDFLAGIMEQTNQSGVQVVYLAGKRRMSMASVCRVAVAAVLATIGGSAIGLGQAPTPGPNPEAVKKAEQVLAEARKALGGDKLTSLKTLVASGRTRRVRGNNIVPIEFEILIELPDKYVRVDEFPAEDTDPTSAGFNGEALIQIPPPPAMPAPGRGGAPPMTPGGAPAGRPPAAMPPGATPPGAMPPTAMPPGGMPGGRGPMMDPRRARLASVKQDFVRLALGLFAASSASPVTFSYAAVAEAPQGRADVLDVKGEGNFALRYFINEETRLPVMVTWTTPPTNVIVTVPGQPPPASVAPGAVVVTGPPAPPAGAAKEETDKYAKDVLALRAKAQATPVEHRLYFADYRDVDGVRFPFRLRRAIGTETTEETTFDRYRLNGKVDPRKFEPVK
jgi:hypothetical protein